MPTASSRSKVSILHLQDILDNLYYMKTKSDAYLAFGQLQLVKQRIDQLKHMNLNTHALREYAIQELLTDIIQQQLQNQRHILDVLRHNSGDVMTREQAIANIKIDVMSNSSKLIGWSLLYHLYIRSDLNFSQKDFATIIHVDARTLLRYRKQITRYLWQHIVQLEIAISSVDNLRCPD